MRIKTVTKTVLLLSIAVHFFLAARLHNNPSDEGTNGALHALHGPSFPLLYRTKDPCAGYDGVLHIQQGDEAGAAGTIFFLFLLNQLVYADMHNLLPWIHLNDYSHWVYDPKVHGIYSNSTFHMLSGVEPSNHLSSRCPGRPILRYAKQSQKINVKGNGVWSSYFAPVSDFDPFRVHSTSCRDKPLITLKPIQILPGLHLHCPWSVRSWRYGGLARDLVHPEQSMHDWLGENRQRAARVVQKYYRLQPSLQHAVDRANPSKHCLAVHIRHSDKANRRRRIKVKKFWPYVQAYLEAGGKLVYLATDSSAVISKIRDEWPKDVVDRIQTQGDGVIRSPNRTAVFEIGNHHRTNIEVLVDIVAMSKCQFLLHGLSAVSEASIYWNVDLHNHSVNLEDPNHMSVDEFRKMVKTKVE